MANSDVELCFRDAKSLGGDLASAWTESGTACVPGVDIFYAVLPQDATAKGTACAIGNMQKFLE